MLTVLEMPRSDAPFLNPHSPYGPLAHWLRLDRRVGLVAGGQS